VISKEIEKAGIPVAFITAMTKIATHTNANRIVAGTKLPHPCGDPNLPSAADLSLRKKIIESALEALQTDIEGTTIFYPDIQAAS
jgi:glycine reductase